ncbi:class I SAM-dependent methyltransferase [Desulfonema ishimotonii]|uniref:Class I SAM-dependent methyltransferase n=1 Tax=Desulfonema ishimotonii TaxID=45657 RepID=A0A401FUM7_9BACT|nr:class I SAM-dependent methyltransferase [Desulfonema ishimotonii]GBC60671.1 class I SAM-dependent methyltransferase [Desulfonema ishimotonii]
MNSVKQHVPEWFSAIAIKEEKKEFELIGPPSFFLDKNPEIHTGFEEFDLAEGALATYAKRDTYPIPLAEDREGYCGDRHFDYWLTGLKDFFSIEKILNDQGVSRDDICSVLDMGCASGRMLRHYDCQAGFKNIWGADINLKNVEWSRKFLSPTIKLLHNTILPHLPVEDNYFDLVTAFSVFTHIDDLEMMWLAEIRRILKKGGYAYITLNTDNTWDNMDEKYPIYIDLIEQRDYIVEHSEKLVPGFNKNPMPSEKLVFTNTWGKVYNTNVFHHRNHIQENWGRFFEIAGFYPNNHLIFQDVVLLKKTD